MNDDEKARTELKAELISSGNLVERVIGIATVVALLLIFLAILL